MAVATNSATVKSVAGRTATLAVTTNVRRRTADDSGNPADAGQVRRAYSTSPAG